MSSVAAAREGGGAGDEGWDESEGTMMLMMMKGATGRAVARGRSRYVDENGTEGTRMQAPQAGAHATLTRLACMHDKMHQNA
eukprot:4455857-Pleurochrysis_carterae.AAC.3